MVDDVTVAIAGGSLAGLYSGLLLRDLGLDVTIYERSRHALEKRGAGIGFLPDASRYLTERLGIDLESISSPIDVIRYLHRDGSVAHERPQHYALSSWFTVFGHLREAFPDDRYLTGMSATEAELLDDSVRVLFADGSSVEADLLVCADGVGSVFRSQFQPQATLNYAGYVAWRGMVPERDLPPALVDQLDGALTYHLGANSQILVYPIPGPEGELERGSRLMNFVWYRNYKAGEDLDDLMTGRDGVMQATSLPPGQVRDVHVEELRAHARARLPQSIAEVVVRVESPFIQVIDDLEVDNLVFGRACLVGDAGFVMRPHAAAGTAKAGANAWALAEALEKHATVPEALAAWEPGQLEIGRNLVRRTRRLGERSQVTNTWDSPDDDTIFRLRDEGP